MAQIPLINQPFTCQMLKTYKNSFHCTPKAIKGQECCKKAIQNS